MSSAGGVFILLDEKNATAAMITTLADIRRVVDFLDMARASLAVGD